MKNFLLINQTYIIKKELVYKYINYKEDKFFFDGGYIGIISIDEISEEYLKKEENIKNLIFL